MAENEVALISGLTPAISEKEVQEEIKSGDWLSRIQIIDPKSSFAMEGKVGQGNFALVHSKDEADDLTNEIDCIIMDVRWKALDISNSEEIINVYDKEADEFKRIQSESEIKDSGCMWGMEFLIWIASVGKYATYFCSSKTARRESKNIHRLIGYPATLRTELIKTKKYSWFGPKVVSCTTPFDVPPKEELVAEVEKFRKSSVSDEVAGDTEERER